MTELQWVGQEDDRGCAIACLAMVTAQTFTEVDAQLREIRTSEGVNSWDVDEYLVEHGYALARIYEIRRRREQRVPWPPSPFADCHLCTVRVQEASPVTHYVVMDKDGVVLDPLSPIPMALDRYWRVYNVTAVVPWRASEATHPDADDARVGACLVRTEGFGEVWEPVVDGEHLHRDLRGSREDALQFARTVSLRTAKEATP